MKKIVFLFSLLIFGLIAASTAHAQRAGSAFAAVPVPGQPVSPAPAPTPTPVTPGPAPGIARPTTPGTPGAKPEEQMRIVADMATNSLIIYGSAQEFQNIKNILKELDIVPRQVLMDVLVAEVTLADTQSLGVEYEIFRGNNPTIFGQTFGSQGALRTGILPGLATGATIAQFATGLSGIVGRHNALQAFITALATDSRVKVLSSPTVLATDNRPARIQVGSEIPILTGQTSTFVTGNAPLTSNAIQYRNTGVILTIIPQVNSLGLVHLQVKQEVSDVGAANFGSTGSPSFTTRDAETTGVVQDGETLAIAGIISERKSRDRTGIPYLMDLPVFGRFFGAATDKTDRTELIMLITPHVVRNRDESRDVTEDLKSKLSAVRNELERLNRDRAAERAKQLPQPPAVAPDVKPTLPAPSSALPSPPIPVPAPSRAPAVSTPSLVPANKTSVPSQVMSSPTPSSNANVELARETRVQKEPIPSPQETEMIPQPPEVEADSAGTDTVGTLLNAIETNSDGTTQTTTSQSQTRKPGPIWVVQIASFVTDKEAQALANKLKGKGYDANVASAEVGGRTWYRVEVGRLASRNEARELQKNLQATEKIEQSIIAGR